VHPDPLARAPARSRGNEAIMSFAHVLIPTDFSDDDRPRVRLVPATQ